MATEKRLIDANALIRTMKEMYCDGCNNYDGIRCRACDFDSAMSDIEDAPTVDVVEVVRCKDCEHYTSWESCLRDGLTDPNPDDYCCFGERRTDNERKAD